MTTSVDKGALAPSGATPQTITFAPLPDRTLGTPPFTVEATWGVTPSARSAWPRWVSDWPSP